MADDFTAEPYRSLLLPSASKCIRVLDIDSASTNTAVIVGHLRVVDLTTSPNFTALSYVWSSREPERTIECNGQDIIVSANGHLALQYLRNSLGAYTIWIDALCINQANTKEKEQQIPLMGTIYSQAATTYVWLGEGNESTDRAISYMKTAGFYDYCHTGGSGAKIGHWRSILAGFSAAIARWSLTRHPFPFEGSPGTLRGPLGPTVVRLWNGKANYTTVEDIRYLLHHRWIERLWTYQEILLAANPVIVCGNAQISWDRFATSVIFLNSTITSLGRATRSWKRVALTRRQIMDAQSLSSRTRGPSFEVYAKFLRRLLIYRALLSLVVWPFLIPSMAILFLWLIKDLKYIANSNGWQAACVVPFLVWVIAIIDIARLVDSGQHMGSYLKEQVSVDDLIDGVYTREAKNPKDMAFGLWAVLERRSLSALPNVDYQKPKETIYVEFSRLLLQITGSPHLLLIAAMNNMKGQPSWAPDWTPNMKRECHWGDIEGLIRFNHGAEDLKRETKGTIFIPMVSERAISVRGRRHGVVIATFVFQRTQSSYQQAEFRKHILNLRLILQLSNIMTRASLFDGSTVTTLQFHRWQRFLHKHRSKEASVLLSLLRDAPPFGNTKVTSMGDSELFRIHVAVCNALAQDPKIFFKGSNPGTLTPANIGWCRRSVKDDDLIVHFPGVQIPLIVRPCSDGRIGVQIKSIAFTPSFTIRMVFQNQFRRMFSRMLLWNKAEEPELEEFHVY